MIKIIKNEFIRLANSEQAIVLCGFFKTGPGEYAEGDRFYGVKVPEIRKLVKKYKDDLETKDILELLKSPMHEERLFALLVWVAKFKTSDLSGQEVIYNLYLKNTRYINNWDLVDLTAEHIIGAWLDLSADKKKTVKIVNNQNRYDILEKLSESSSLWERRIAMVSTFYFIKNGRPEITLYLAEKLINDPHDLIHKATGWMLREVGKRCGELILDHFLKGKYQKMPRTMLRYAIEKMDYAKRQAYLKDKV